MKINRQLLHFFLPNWAVSLCGLTGTALLMSGVVCFFAYNWENMGLVLKLGLPLFGLSGCALAAYCKGLESKVGKVLSFCSGIFIGIFWAVYGQIYQTGSFVYEFLGVWAGCLLPLAVLAGNRWLWLLWAGLLNGYYLYLSAEHLFWQIFLLNAVCFVFCERAYFQKKQGGLFSLFFLIPALLACLINGLYKGGVWVSVCLVLLLAVYAYAKKRGASQLGLSVCVLDCLLMRWLVLDMADIWVNMSLSLFIYVSSAWGVYMLTSREKEHE